MLILGFDLETGESFDKRPEENFITELGAVLWDTQTNMPVQMMNTLISDIPKDVHPEAEEYTGISSEMCRTHGIPQQRALLRFNEMLEKADALMAHNGRAFDRVVTKSAYEVEGIPTNTLMDKIFIDSMTDIEYPRNCKQRNLGYLASFHILLNCFPHRAVTDVLTMMTIASKYDWNRTVEVAKSPNVKLVAEFSYPQERRYPNAGEFQQAMKDFNEVKDAIKKLGFGWRPETKQWVLESKNILVKGMEFPCPVKVVQ